MFRFRNLLTITGSFCICFSARAERGIEPPAHSLHTPISNFPGAFDTFVPEPKTIVTSATIVLNPFLPIVGAPVEYGVTENFSLGTNAAVPYLWSSGVPAIGGKLRYRLPITERFVLSFTNWSYWGETKDGKNTQSFTWQMNVLSSNWFISPRFWLQANLGWASSDIFRNKSGDESYQRASLSTAFAGAGVVYMPTSWFGMRGLAFYPFFVDISSDGGSLSSGGQSVSLQGGKQFLFYAFGPDFKLGERWLLSPGLLASDSTGAAGVYFDASFRW